jgi:hypothetical protein
VRGWLSSELDVVVSAKEAEKSKDHLIADRKELTAELAKLKTAMRRTQPYFPPNKKIKTI